MPKPKAIFNWSTGKDSALALDRTLAAGDLDVRWLLTTVNDQHDRVSMHGVRTELLRAQADALGLPLVQIRLPDVPTMEAYEAAMGNTLHRLREEGAEVSVFGDIFLEDLRAYREHKLAELGLRAVFPLWDLPTDALVREVIDRGFKAVTTCVNTKYLGKDFAGRLLDDAFVRDLPSGVDPCGENGEFHTFTFDGPLFAHSVRVRTGDIVYRTYERPTAGAAEPSAQDPAPSPGQDQAPTHTCGSSTSDPFQSGFWYCDLLPA
jgi:uncharacterized protein (TIGR00290 family)